MRVDNALLAFVEQSKLFSAAISCNHCVTRLSIEHNLARAGKVVLDAEARDAMVARDRCREQLALLDESQKRIVNPHSYPVGLEYSLFYRRRDLVSRLLGLS